MNLATEVLTVHLAQPFVSNAGATTTVHQVVARLEENDLVGVGTALLSKRQAAPDGRQLAAAIDMAQHDHQAKAAGCSLRDLWRVPDARLAPTAVSLGASSAAELIERARALADWPILKLKMTSGTDIETVARLRDIYAGRIWVDGNGAWNAAGAIAAAEAFARHGVELLEQPIPAGTPRLLQYVRERSAVPIVADEDCLGLSDVARLAGCVDVINIKLIKCGNLRTALDMVYLARRLGLGVMLGCKTESVLGTTAMAQLAGLADYLDLDGHLDLVDDPFAGMRIERGQIVLPEAPGLGVTTFVLSPRLQTGAM
jgi:L-alanine-DL-glutamate epimerase-like enolase superfamily enzyme